MLPSSLPVEAGDIVVYPMGDANINSSSPGMRGEPDLAMYALPTDGRLPTATFYYGEGPDKYHIVCGYFGCDARPFNPLLEALPRMFRARLSAASQSWLLAMLQVASEESELGEAGSEAMLAKFAEVDVRRGRAQLCRPVAGEFARLAVGVTRRAGRQGAAIDPRPTGAGLDRRQPGSRSRPVAIGLR